MTMNTDILHHVSMLGYDDCTIDDICDEAMRVASTINSHVLVEYDDINLFVHPDSKKDYLISEYERLKKCKEFRDAERAHTIPKRTARLRDALAKCKSFDDIATFVSGEDFEIMNDTDIPTAKLVSERINEISNSKN